MIKAKLSSEKPKGDIPDSFEVGLVGDVPVVTYRVDDALEVIYLDVRDMGYQKTGCGHDFIECAVKKYGPYRRLRPGETIEITCVED